MNWPTKWHKKREATDKVWSMTLDEQKNIDNLVKEHIGQKDSRESNLRILIKNIEDRKAVENQINTLVL